MPEPLMTRAEFIAKIEADGYRFQHGTVWSNFSGDHKGTPACWIVNEGFAKHYPMRCWDHDNEVPLATR